MILRRTSVAAVAMTLGGLALTDSAEAGGRHRYRVHSYGPAAAPYRAPESQVFAYWYGCGTPGPGYWAGSAPAFAFPSVAPNEFSPAYGNDLPVYQGRLAPGTIEPNSPWLPH